MLPLSAFAELLDVPLRFRVDAIAFVGFAAGAAWFCRRIVHRRQAAASFSALTWPALIGLVAAALLISEWAVADLSFSINTPVVSIALARGFVLGTMTFLTAILLSHATLIALMRAEIRQHAVTELQLAKAKTAADDASRAKSEFLAVMSHEIRTPLNAVMGFANLLAETSLDAAQRDYLHTITTEGRRLNSLVSDILDLTKIEEGRLALERLPFAPVETAHEVLRLLSARALEKQVDLRFEAQVAGPLLVAGDPLRFRQILLNLVDNAIKFTPRGTVTLFLVWTPTEVAGKPGKLEVRVEDTGIGIAPEKLKDLFQMFMQVDTSTTRRFGGTGLGLAICHRLVAMMGGDIVAQSTRGTGSTFSFTLSLSPIAAPAEVCPLPVPADEPVAHRPRVLVVDDMDTNRLLLEIFLRRHGFEPELAANGQEAVRMAATKHFDAILMDLQMPDIDGFAATQQIRAAEAGRARTPVIALTASITKGTREKCLAAGMDEYLTKPLDLRRFKALLDNFIARSAPSASSKKSS